MGWTSTPTSLTIDEFFKQELAVDQGDEKNISVSEKKIFLVFVCFFSLLKVRGLFFQWAKFLMFVFYISNLQIV